MHLIQADPIDQDACRPFDRQASFSPLHPIYEVDKLLKVYPKSTVPANDNISFTVQEGEIIGLLGPNGAGKTTLIRQMLGLLRPTSGRVFLLGEVVSDPKQAGCYVSYLPQGGYGAGFWQLTAYEVIVYTAMLRGLNRSHAQEQAKLWMSRLHIERLKERLLGKISGGERRLASLAAALAGLPKILVADEPTNDLDPEARQRVWGIFQELNAETNLTIILVTHNVLEADKVVQKVGIFEQGKLLVYEPTIVLKKRLPELRVDVMGNPNQFDGIQEKLSHHGRLLILGKQMSLYCSIQDFQDILPLLRNFRESGMEWKARTPNLEDIYFSFGGTRVGLQNL